MHFNTFQLNEETRNFIQNSYTSCIEDARAASSRLKKTTRIFWFWIIDFPFLLWFNTIVWTWIFPLKHTTTIGILSSSLFPYSASCSLIFFLYFLMNFYKEKNQFFGMVEKKIFLEITESDMLNYPNLSQIISNLISRMQLDCTIRIWRNPRSSGYLPSIVVKNQIVNLVLPVGFLILCATHPDEAHAMLAHEFGHVIQNDTNIWEITNSIGDVTYKSFIIYIMLNINSALLLRDLLAEVISKNGLVWPIVGGFMNISYIQIGKHFVKMRKQVTEFRIISETLADINVILYSDPSAFVGAVDKYVRDGKHRNLSHPPKSHRIEQMHSSLASWIKMADGDPCAEAKRSQPFSVSVKDQFKQHSIFFVSRGVIFAWVVSIAGILVWRIIAALSGPSAMQTLPGHEWDDAREAVSAMSKNALTNDLQRLEIGQTELDKIVACQTDGAIAFLNQTDCKYHYDAATTSKADHMAAQAACTKRVGFEIKNTETTIKCYREHIPDDWKIFHKQILMELDTVSEDAETNASQQAKLNRCIADELVKMLNMSDCKPLNRKTQKADNLFLTPDECVERHEIAPLSEALVERCRRDYKEPRLHSRELIRKPN